MKNIVFCILGIVLISLACNQPKPGSAPVKTPTAPVAASLTPNPSPTTIILSTTIPPTAQVPPTPTKQLNPTPTNPVANRSGQIVFVSCKGHNSLGGGTQCGIHIMDGDGSHIRQLTNNDSDGGVSLSPDGTRVLFIRKDQHYEIYEIHTDGSGLKRLPNDPGEGGTDPSWSPDGSQIFYISNSKPPSCAIFVMDADGNNPHPLINSWDCNGYSLRWSPDGSQIIFLTHITNTSSTLHIMNADGSHRQVIKTSPALDIVLPVWSPDGAKIAFLNQKTFNEPVEVDVINKDGTNQHSLTAGFYPVYGGLSWSPDGQQLIFNMNGDGKSIEGATHIFVVNGDGSDLHRLNVGCPGYSCANAYWGH